MVLQLPLGLHYALCLDQPNKDLADTAAALVLARDKVRFKTKASCHNAQLLPVCLLAKLQLTFHLQQETRIIVEVPVMHGL